VIRVRRARLGTFGGLLCLLAGCGLFFPPIAQDPAASPPEASDFPDRRPEGLIPAGLGTLTLDQISVEVRRGALQLYLTPLDEPILRTATPELWERLSALRRVHQGWFRDRIGSDAVWTLFLVTAVVEMESVRMEPEEITLISRGIRYRPVEIRGVSPGWDAGVVHPREPLVALYAFPPQVSLEGDLEVEYLEIRNRDWGRTLLGIQAEEARIRARGSDHSSPKR
jgi:hypothetical protein